MRPGGELGKRQEVFLPPIKIFISLKEAILAAESPEAVFNTLLESYRQGKKIKEEEK